MKKILLFVFILGIIPGISMASLELGAGLNSAFNGRMVPTLTASITGSKFALTAFSSGVNSTYYYHSTYGLAWYYTMPVRDILGGKVNFGFGLGTFYAERGFQDMDSSRKEKKSDYASGPAIRLNYTFAGFIYFNMEAMYGLRSLYHNLTLNFQDMVVTSIGIRIW